MYETILPEVSNGNVNLPVVSNGNANEIPSAIKEILIMDGFPDDKQVEIEVVFKVVPDTMKIWVSKKQ